MGTDTYEILPGAEGTSPVLGCKRCGAVVWDAEQHDYWHRVVHVEPSRAAVPV